MQHDDAVGQFAHDIHFVFDQHDDLAGIALELAYQVEHDRHFVHAHAGGGLVEHEDHRIQRHQHGDLELALVAMRQVGGRLVAPVFEPHARQQHVGALDQHPIILPAAPETDLPRSLRAGLQGEPQVLMDGQPGEQLGQLEGTAQARMQARGDAQAGQVAPAQPHGTRAGAQLPRYEVEVGGLAGAIGADDGRERARRIARADVLDGRVAAEPDGERTGFQHAVSAC